MKLLNTLINFIRNTCLSKISSVLKLGATFLILIFSIQSHATELPDKFKALDLNKDSRISSQEVATAISDFFSGKKNYNIDYLTELIDYFYDSED